MGKKQNYASMPTGTVAQWHGAPEQIKHLVEIGILCDNVSITAQTDIDTNNLKEFVLAVIQYYENVDCIMPKDDKNSVDKKNSTQKMMRNLRDIIRHKLRVYELSKNNTYKEYYLLYDLTNTFYLATREIIQSMKLLFKVSKSRSPMWEDIEKYLEEGDLDKFKKEKSEDLLQDLENEGS